MESMPRRPDDFIQGQDGFTKYWAITLGIKLFLFIYKFYSFLLSFVIFVHIWPVYFSPAIERLCQVLSS